MLKENAIINEVSKPKGQATPPVDTTSMAVPQTSEKPLSSDTISLISLCLDEIYPDNEQPRKEFLGIEGIAESYRASEPIAPIMVYKNSAGHFIIMDGERRYRALKLLNEKYPDDNKWKNVTALYFTNGNRSKGILTNIAKHSYNPMEYAQALEFIGKELGEDVLQRDIAVAVDKSRSNVAEYMSLLKLPKEVINKAMHDSRVPFNKLKSLAAKVKELTPAEIISRYDKLYEEYTPIINDKNSSQKKPRRGTGEKAREEIIKKLDKFADGIEKWEIGKISTLEAKKELSEHLEALIHKIQKMKNELEVDMNS